MGCSKTRRERQRGLQRENRKQEHLERKNLFGLTDLTPYNVGLKVKGKEIAYR